MIQKNLPPFPTVSPVEIKKVLEVKPFCKTMNQLQEETLWLH